MKKLIIIISLLNIGGCLADCAQDNGSHCYFSCQQSTTYGADIDTCHKNCIKQICGIS